MSILGQTVRTVQEEQELTFQGRVSDSTPVDPTCMSNTDSHVPWTRMSRVEQQGAGRGRKGQGRAGQQC